MNKKSTFDGDELKFENGKLKINEDFCQNENLPIFCILYFVFNGQAHKIMIKNKTP